jgi:hypothetical protein
MHNDPLHDDFDFPEQSMKSLVLAMMVNCILLSYEVAGKGRVPYSD